VKRYRLTPEAEKSIFYRPENAGIQVIRVIHGHRDIPKLFE